MMHMGGYPEYCGAFSTVGRYHDACGGYHEYHGGVQYRGGIISTVEVILSTVGDTQYRGGYHDARGGYHVYCGGIPTFVY